MEIVINGVKHVAEELKMRHWRIIEQFKTGRRERVEELKTLLELVGTITDERQAEKTFNEIEHKADENKRINIDTKVKILSEIFVADFEDVEITDIHETYSKVEAWVDALISGRVAKLPNGGAQAEG